MNKYTPDLYREICLYYGQVQSHLEEIEEKGSVSSQNVTFLTLEDAIWYSETVKSDPKHFEVEVIPVFYD